MKSRGAVWFRCMFTAAMGALLWASGPLGAQDGSPSQIKPEKPMPKEGRINPNALPPHQPANVDPLQIRFRADPRGNDVYSALQASQGIAADHLDVANAINELIVGRFVDRSDEMFGATLQPVSEAMRTQLSIPAGQGLLVSALRADGPTAQAGLLQNDVLLTLADKPVGTVDDLSKQLKAAGEAAAPLKVLRAGKPVTIQVRPVYRVTLGAPVEQKSEYYIGVQIEGADEALRTQLGLPGSQGVVVNEVLADSPAEKAGVKKYDVIVALNGKDIDGTETLTKQVQAAKDKNASLGVLRAGKRLTIPITGAVRKVQTNANVDAEALRVWMIDSQRPAHFAWTRTLGDYVAKPEAANQSDEVRNRLNSVEKELKALHEAVERLNETLKSNKAKK